jgi:hypothetical protein
MSEPKTTPGTRFRMHESRYPGRVYEVTYADDNWVRARVVVRDLNECIDVVAIDRVRFISKAEVV